MAKSKKSNTRTKAFIHHRDNGHGWLAVKVQDLNEVLFKKSDITKYSYEKGNTVYLEEDIDAENFISSFKNKFEINPKIKMAKQYKRHRIRSYLVVQND